MNKKLRPWMSLAFLCFSYVLLSFLSFVLDLALNALVKIKSMEALVKILGVPIQKSECGWNVSCT